MKVSYFQTTRYRTMQEIPIDWPMPPSLFEPEIGERVYETAIDELKLAEEVGFDWISLSEHHFSRTLTPAPIVLQAFLAGQLKKAKLAMLGPNMLLSNPVRVAEELAMLDQLSHGRVIAGLLRGTTNEYLVNDVNPAETRDIAQEAMDLILKAWTEPQPFSWQGRHFQYRTVSVWPKPLQQPIPPTYVLGGSKETSEFAAARGLGIGLAYQAFSGVKQSADYYHERCDYYGWKPDRDQIIYRANLLIGKTDEEALSGVESYRQTFGGTYPMRPSVQEYVNQTASTGAVRSPSAALRLFTEPLPVTFVGSPETIIAKIRECREELGAGVIDITVVADEPKTEKIRRNIEMFGEKVLPKIKDV